MSQTSLPVSLRVAARAVLIFDDAAVKAAAAAQLARANAAIDPLEQLDELPGIPGRPVQPRLVAPGAVATRGVGTAEGRAALLHALAHIEFNAINLALDAIWRFAGMPAAYYSDWLGVAAEEAEHFLLLATRLEAMGYAYGDFAAHDGLWEMAAKTRDDVLARMALVPRTLEARGLDASPQIIAKLRSVGDEESAQIVERILRDEIGHVAIGNRWYRYVCAQRRLDPATTYDALALSHKAPRLRGPFNISARQAAGFHDEEIDALLRHASG